jgi:fluoroquinolone transport system ATP-binding protein
VLNDHGREASFHLPEAAEPAFKGLHCGIARGEIFGLLGSSGAGKSTTQKILIGLLKDYHQHSVYMTRLL